MDTTTYSTSIIRASDFSDSVSDTLRDRWTDGKMRHVIAALAGDPVIVTTDSGSGHSLVGVRLVGITPDPHGSSLLRIESEHGVTAYSAFMLGDTIVPLAGRGRTRGAKWDALDSYRRERSAAIAVARTLREQDGAPPERGRWEAIPLRDGVIVTYQPQREGAGDRWSMTVPLDRLSAAAAL